MLRVIVNSTPLLSLGNIGRLGILKELYGKIVIPEAVYDEVLIKNDEASRFVADADWISVVQADNNADRRMYRSRLHAGEVEVMILAQQSPPADLLILDDKAARQTAEYLGLPFTGTVGVLFKAKEKGIISAVLPILEELENNGFFVSERVKQMIAQKADEKI